jgi:hypothetical protein
MKEARSVLLSLAALLISLALAPGAPPAAVTYTPFSDAEPVLDALAEVLPPGLRTKSHQELESMWPSWVKSRDAEIRERLNQGDEDTIINLLLFGTSFTQEPRLTVAQLKKLSPDPNEVVEGEPGTQLRALIQSRVQDLIIGMDSPGNNERLLFARKVAERAGIKFSDVNGKEEAALYLYEKYLRVLREQSSYQQLLAAAHSLGDPTEEFAERSKIYKDRGLSLDTSLPPDFALEVALTTMRDRGLLSAGSVRRVGIIGPGLDFTDKQEGYDFYRTQTVQPFAVMDSLVRLGLVKPGKLEVDSFDLSSRVLEHVERARRAALQGRPYTIQLPRDPLRGWKPELVAYWNRFGDQIGSSVPPVAVPSSLQGIELRAVSVRPTFVKRMRALDVNIVLQREELPEKEKFDLLVATNVLVYYDTLEQSLALTNIQSMLRPGGFLLSNNLLLELPSLKMSSGDYVSVEYSSRPADGDRILWYRRLQ